MGNISKKLSLLKIYYAISCFLVNFIRTQTKKQTQTA